MLQDEFKKMCQSDPKEACLFALSRMVLRHISNKHKQELKEIGPVIIELDSEKPEFKMIKSILDSIKTYDKEVIKYLIESEINVVNFLRNQAKVSICGRGPLRVEQQREKIKSWWK